MESASHLSNPEEAHPLITLPFISFIIIQHDQKSTSLCMFCNQEESNTLAYTICLCLVAKYQPNSTSHQRGEQDTKKIGEENDVAMPRAKAM
jgi:hypothetical protein